MYMYNHEASGSLNPKTCQTSSPVERSSHSWASTAISKGPGINTTPLSGPKYASTSRAVSEPYTNGFKIEGKNVSFPRQSSTLRSNDPDTPDRRNLKDDTTIQPAFWFKVCGVRLRVKNLRSFISMLSKRRLQNPNRTPILPSPPKDMNVLRRPIPATNHAYPVRKFRVPHP